jgi:tetratricopeptide (TPR) repeat protein
LTQNIYLLRKTLKSIDPASSIRNVPRRGYIFDSPVDFDNETVIERHLFERIEIDEIDDTQSASETRIILPRSAQASSRAFWLFSALAGAVLLASIAYFYFRPSQQNAAITPSTSRSLKAFSSPSKIKSLTVLPFRSLSKELGLDFANDVAIRLGSKNKFAVRPVALINEYQKNEAEFANDFVLTGDIQMDDSGFTAHARLIDTGDGSEIWSDKFEYDNVVQIQDAIANKVAVIVVERMTSVEREMVSKRLPTNHAAYENFQTGYLLWRRRTDGSAYFQRAVDLDQNFASAYAFLASGKAMLDVKGSNSSIEAENLLRKALILDENLAEAHAVQGFIRIFHHHDWGGAERSLQTAIELDGNNINARHWLGVLHSVRRRLDDAKAEMRRALEIDPTNPTLLADLGQTFYFEGEAELAREHINRALAVDRAHPFAIDYMKTMDGQTPLTSDADLLRDLERAAAGNGFILPFIKVNPKYNSIRDTPRFQKILRDINLAQ